MTNTKVEIPVTVMRGLVEVALSSDRTPHGLYPVLVDICAKNPHLDDLARRLMDTIQTTVDEGE